MILEEREFEMKEGGGLSFWNIVVLKERRVVPELKQLRRLAGLTLDVIRGELLKHLCNARLLPKSKRPFDFPFPCLPHGRNAAFNCPPSLRDI